MLKIAIGGQLGKEKIAATIKKAGENKIEVTVMQDVSAAMAVKQNKADYYFGACNTGGGGALALAIAILGMPQCQTLASPGAIAGEQEIINSVNSGKKAFGVTEEAIEKVVPVFVEAVLNKNS